MTMFRGYTLAFCIDKRRREQEWELKHNLEVQRKFEEKWKQNLEEPRNFEEKLIETEFNQGGTTKAWREAGSRRMKSATLLKHWNPSKSVEKITTLHLSGQVRWDRVQWSWNSRVSSQCFFGHLLWFNKVTCTSNLLYYVQIQISSSDASSLPAGICGDTWTYRILVSLFRLFPNVLGCCGMYLDEVGFA